MRFWAGTIFIAALIILGLYLAANWAAGIVGEQAAVECAKVGAKPDFIYRNNYICVTPDGRVVG